jgi:hypothetical protein
MSEKHGLCLHRILSEITTLCISARSDASPRNLRTPSGILGYHVAVTWNFHERDTLQKLS